MASSIASAYDYYLATYGSKHMSRYDSHKKEDLRDTINRIRKINKESPLYHIKISGDIQKFAIDVKENARNIKNVVASLSETEAGIGGAFGKKTAVSSNPEIVSVEYTGAQGAPADACFSLEVQRLATPQTNIGNFLKKTGHDFNPGSYAFDLNTNTNSYEFQYNVNAGDTNEDVLRKLARLVNNSNIGLSADLLSGGPSLAALRIESKQTGLSEHESYLFRIIPENTIDSRNAMRTLGIDSVAAPAENASFLLNGAAHTSRANTFAVDNAFSMTLHDISPKNQPVTIRFKSGAETVADDIQSLVDSFNSMLLTAEGQSGSRQSNKKLLADMGNVAKSFSSDFHTLGLSVSDTGAISVNHDQLTYSVSSKDADQSLEILNNFKDAVGKKAERASLDPMNYVNKILIVYKNPGKNFVCPYITSIYTGMMIDRIC